MIDIYNPKMQAQTGIIIPENFPLNTSIYLRGKRTNVKITEKRIIDPLKPRCEE